jgi:23S rRNA (adenine2503-C2)-methyltransferase
MVDAFLQVRDETPGRVTGAVFQGQGVPFHDYERVIRAAQVRSYPCGGRIAAAAVTISNVGLVPQVRRHARERHRYRSIVWLTSSIAKRRRSLSPVAGRFSSQELADVRREYAAVAPGLVTVAWVMLGRVNTGRDEEAALKALRGDLPLRVNLIDVIDAREEASDGPRLPSCATCRTRSAKSACRSRDATRGVRGASRFAGCSPRRGGRA